MKFFSESFSLLWSFFLFVALSKKNPSDTKDGFSVLWFRDFPIMCVPP